MTSNYLQTQTAAATHASRRGSSSSSSSRKPASISSSYSTDSFNSSRSSMDAPRRSMTNAVVTMRCSRCAKSSEAIVSVSRDGASQVTSHEASANGMVRFGHNLYYCERCAKTVGYT